ncbi:MAG: amino acid permease [Gammaproteobacteria bacterium]
MSVLFRKHPLPPGTDALVRSLGRWDLVGLGIGAIIGAGVFVLTGVAAATQAGPALVLSFVVAAVACGFAGFAYAELAAAVGGSGSAYGYAYAALGEIVAWIIGWALMLEYGMAIAAVAVGWAGYFDNALAAVGWSLPAALRHAPGEGGLLNLPAFAVIVALGLLLAHGTRGSARVNGAIVLVKLAAIVVFLAVGIGRVEPVNWHPFMPFGWSGVLHGAALIFFAYIGFDAVSTAAAEARDPARDLPFGILASLVLCTLLYVAVAAVLTGMAPYHTLNVPSPVAQALLDHGLRWAAALVAAGAIAGLTSVMLVMFYGQTRVLYAMAGDGLLPPGLARIEPRSRTPRTAIAVTGTVTALTAALLPIRAIAELVNIGTLSAYVAVCAGVIALRIQAPDLPRPYRAPGGIWCPLAGALACLFLMVQLPAATWWRYFAWMAAGLLVYAAYGYRHARRVA